MRISRQGKDNAVRAILKRIEADVYVMLDADATYGAARIPISSSRCSTALANMVVGTRLGSPDAGPSVSSAAPA